MAYQEHDDTAYAADVEGPAPSPSPSPTEASFRRPRGSRSRQLGSHSSRLRQQPPTKRDEAASDVEPLRFVQGGPSGQSAKGRQHHARIHTRNDGGSASSASSASSSTPGLPLLGSSKPAAHRNKFDFDHTFDERPGTGDENVPKSALSARSVDGDSFSDGNGNRTGNGNASSDWADRKAHDLTVLPPLSPLPQSPSSPSSPVSPRWASLADRYPRSPSAATSVPVSSVHTSIASVGFSTAPTSPISPTPSASAAKSLLRTPSSASASAPRFVGLSSHPFIVGNPASQLVSSPTEDPFPDFSSSPPLPPPRSGLRSPTPSLAGHPGAMTVGNFSRPRQPSMKQGARDVPSTTTLRLRRPEPLQLESIVPAASPSSPVPQSQERARGVSTSSNKSVSSYSSLDQRSSNDHPHPTQPPPPSTQDSVAASPGLSRPPAAHSRANSTGSDNPSTANANSSSRVSLSSTRGLPQQQRDQLLTTADAESRSSYRSQGTASTAHKTIFTNSGTVRSSVLSKASSRASMAWFTNAPTGADEDLSVDDVMGLYEKGFGDSTGAEDTDGPYGGPAAANDLGDDDVSDGDAHGGNVTPSAPQSDALGSGLTGAQISHALSGPLPVPSRAANQSGVAGDTALDAPRPVRYSGLSSSAPNASGLGLATQHMMNRQLLVPGDDDTEDGKAKRDSAKMLNDNSPGRLSPLPSPNSRPGSGEAPSLFARAQGESDDPALRDRYGFRKNNHYITVDQYDAWNGPYTEYMGRRRRKWVAYLRDSGLITNKPTRFPPPSVKTKRFIRKGIPPEWRGAAWFYYAGGPSIVAKHPGIYDKLIVRASHGEAKDVDIETIERDLHRTFPDNVAFKFSGDEQPGHGDNDQARKDGTSDMDITADRPNEPKIVSKLRRVLLAFSIYNPRIGYCQSLNFLAGLLLLFVETEEHCFWLLNVITRIFLPGTHDLSLEGSKVDVSVLMASLQESLPSVWAKIGGDLDSAPTGLGSHSGRDTPKHGTIGRKMKLPRAAGGRAGDASSAVSPADRLPPITVCMMAWFMSCFIGTLPIETTLRVWDIFFYEGSKTLFRVALAIFKLGEPEIRAVTDPMEMFGVVQELPRRLLDCNMLMETTFRRRNGFGHLSQESVEEKRRECRDAFKSALNNAQAAANSPAATVPGGLDAVDGADGPVRRKGTLFGRRRDRRPAEVM